MSEWLISLVREGADLFIRREIFREISQRLIAEAIFIACISVFGLATLVFFYIFAYCWLRESFEPTVSAAIVAGANLILIGLVLLIRSIIVQRRTPPATAALGGLKGLPISAADAHTLGRELGGVLKKVAPEMVIGAVVAGLVVGLDPSWLGRRKDRRG